MRECGTSVLVGDEESTDLLEGMACPGGCVAGAGTIQPIKKTVTSLELMKKQAEFEECMDTKYEEMLPKLEQL